MEEKIKERTKGEFPFCHKVFKKSSAANAAKRHQKALGKGYNLKSFEAGDSESIILGKQLIWPKISVWGNGHKCM